VTANPRRLYDHRAPEVTAVVRGKDLREHDTISGCVCVEYGYPAEGRWIASSSARDGAFGVGRGTSECSIRGADRFDHRARVPYRLALVPAGHPRDELVDAVLVG